MDNKQHGGARPNSGRKPGSGKGRTVTTASISMKPEMWDKLDTLRGEQSRGAFLTEKIRRMKISSSNTPDPD